MTNNTVIVIGSSVTELMHEQGKILVREAVDQIAKKVASLIIKEAKMAQQKNKHKPRKRFYE
jgi:hypothetical protein